MLEVESSVSDMVVSIVGIIVLGPDGAAGNKAVGATVGKSGGALGVNDDGAGMSFGLTQKSAPKNPLSATTHPGTVSKACLW